MHLLRKTLVLMLLLSQHAYAVNPKRVLRRICAAICVNKDQGQLPQTCEACQDLSCRVAHKEQQILGLQTQLDQLSVSNAEAGETIADLRTQLDQLSVTNTEAEETIADLKTQVDQRSLKDAEAERARIIDEGKKAATKLVDDAKQKQVSFESAAERAKSMMKEAMAQHKSELAQLYERFEVKSEFAGNIVSFCIVDSQGIEHCVKFDAESLTRYPTSLLAMAISRVNNDAVNTPKLRGLDPQEMLLISAAISHAGGVITDWDSLTPSQQEGLRHTLNFLNIAIDPPKIHPIPSHPLSSHDKIQVEVHGKLISLEEYVSLSADDTQNAHFKIPGSISQAQFQDILSAVLSNIFSRGRSDGTKLTLDERQRMILTILSFCLDSASNACDRYLRGILPPDEYSDLRDWVLPFGQALRAISKLSKDNDRMHRRLGTPYGIDLLLHDSALESMLGKQNADGIDNIGLHARLSPFAEHMIPKLMEWTVAGIVTIANAVKDFVITSSRRLKYTDANKLASQLRLIGNRVSYIQSYISPWIALLEGYLLKDEPENCL